MTAQRFKNIVVTASACGFFFWLVWAIIQTAANTETREQQKAYELGLY